MEEEQVSMLVAMAGAILAVIGIFVLFTTFVMGATIDIMGYGMGALLIFEGASHFAP